MKKVKYCLLLFGLLVVHSVFSQTGDVVVITGTVGFTQGNFPVPGIDVTFSSDAGEVQTTLTDDFGDYTLEFDLIPGQPNSFLGEVTDLCLGTPLTQTVTTSVPDTITVDFILCDSIFPPPPSDCDPYFHWEQDFNDPLTVYFTDLSYSSDDIDSWAWDFGDGETSTEQNPEHEYDNFGEYFVTLTIVSDTCTSTITQHVIVEDFSTSGCEAFFFGFGTDGLTYQFVDFSWTSFGTIDSWSWDFGDGSTSSEQNPEYTYATEGVYPVTLTITADSCTSTFTQDIDVQTITIPDCEASFFTSFTTNPLEIIFNDQSIPAGEINSWAWDFGDGTTSTEQNPTHTYSEEGVYEITLTISTDTCTSTVVQLIDVFEVSQCEAGFFTLGLDSFTVQFIDVSQTVLGIIDTWSWDFGDGNTSNEPSPLHTYADTGSYDVTLVISALGCTDTFTTTIDIPFFDGGYGNDCYAFFDYYVIDPDNPTEIQFNDLSDGDVVSWEWYFGNGEMSTDESPVYYYATEGIYDVTLTITTADGCTSTFVTHIYVGDAGTPPTPLDCQAFFFFEQDPIDLMTFNFVNFSFGTDLVYEWDFGDGMTSTEMNPIHTYTEDGIYQVELTVSNDSCSNTMAMILITDWDIWYDNECNAVFLPVIIPDSNQVFILNFSSSDAITFEWDFGDGTTSTESSPFHTYDSAGIYTISLEITTAAGCTSSFEVTIDLHNSNFTGDATSSAIQLSTSTEGVDLKEPQVAVYPNPVKDRLRIDVENYIGEQADYQLFNTAGQLIKQGQLEGSISIDVSNLLDGFYLLQIKGQDLKHNQKIIKQSW